LIALYIYAYQLARWQYRHPSAFTLALIVTMKVHQGLTVKSKSRAASTLRKTPSVLGWKVEVLLNRFSKVKSSKVKSSKVKSLKVRFLKVRYAKVKSSKVRYTKVRYSKGDECSTGHIVQDLSIPIPQPKSSSITHPESWASGHYGSA
jgi:hypothetical protein